MKILGPKLKKKKQENGAIKNTKELVSFFGGFPLE
jgi:hypothetical protein